MVALTRLGVLSVAKMQAIISAVIGLIIGILFAVTSLLTPSIADVSPGYPPAGAPTGYPGSMPTTSADISIEGGFMAGLGLLMIIIAPIASGIMGFIGGAIGAWLYNLIARWFGGIEMEFEH